jgi:hypothetical protein
MAAYSTANDPIMQRYIELLRTNPALAQQIDERTAELFGQPELNVYNRGLRNVVTPEGGGADAAYREVPRATALRTAIEELDVPGAAATPPVAPVEPTAPAATNGADLAAVDERLRTLNKLTGADIPVMRDRTPTGLTDDELRQQMESQFTGFDAFFHGADTAADDAAKAKADQARQKQSKMGRGRFTLDQPERPDEEWKLSPVPSRPQYGRQVAPPLMREFPTQQKDEQDEEAPAPAAKPVVETQETPQEDAPAGSILSRIGRYAKENPDIALAGMEGIGNLLANIGAARGQRKADEATQQGMARSNLISALTGGRVRPAVAEETPEMGLLGRVGQAVGTAGKLGREVEQERAERGFEQQEIDRKEAELQRKIERDAGYIRNIARKERWTQSQIENHIAQQTIAMNKVDAALYRTRVMEELGLAKLDLARDKFVQDSKEFDELLAIKSRGMNVREGFLQLGKEKQDLLWKQFGEELKLDKRRVDVLEKKADAYIESVENEANRILFEKEDRDSKRFRETRSIIKNDINGGILKGFMGSERGTFKTYQGLLAAFADYQNNPNAANMNGLFNMYQQLFDPATVREGDLELQRRGQGIFADIAATIQRTKGEGFVLSQGTIEDMKAVADEFYDRMLDFSIENLNGYLDEGFTVSAREAAGIRNYYGKLWGVDIGAAQGAAAGGTGTGTGTADATDDYLDEVARQAGGAG